MSIDNFKKLHSELKKELEDYEVREQKRNDRAEEILSEMHGIADTSHDISKKLRLRRILSTVFIALLFLFPIVNHFVEDKISSFIIICVLLGLIFIVKFLLQYFKPLR